MWEGREEGREGGSGEGQGRGQGKGHRKIMGYHSVSLLTRYCLFFFFLISLGVLCDGSVVVLQ